MFIFTTGWRKEIERKRRKKKSLIFDEHWERMNSVSWFEYALYERSDYTDYRLSGWLIEYRYADMIAPVEMQNNGMKFSQRYSTSRSFGSRLLYIFMFKWFFLSSYDVNKKNLCFLSFSFRLICVLVFQEHCLFSSKYQSALLFFRDGKFVLFLLFYHESNNHVHKLKRFQPK